MPLYAPIANDKGPDAVLSAALAIDGDEISVMHNDLMPGIGDVSVMRFGAAGEVIKVIGASGSPYSIERELDGTTAAAQTIGAELAHVMAPTAILELVPEGEQGPQGEAGPQGDPGPAGVDGEDGDDGAPGPTVPATTADLGAVIMATAPVDPDEPLAVGDNDPRLTDARTPTAHGHTKGEVGLGSVDNTADSAKPVSTAQATADGLRVLKAGDTMTGPLVGPNGSAAIPTFRFADVGMGLYRLAQNILALAVSSSWVARASSSEFRVSDDHVLRARTLLIDETVRYAATTVPSTSALDGTVIGDDMDTTQTTILVEEVDSPPTGTTYPCAAVIAESTVDEEWVIVHARSSGGEYTIQRGYPIGSGVGKAHAYGDTFRLVGDGSATDYNGNPDCHNFVFSNISKTVNIFANTLSPASGPQTIDFWLPPRSSIGAWAAPADGKEFKFQFRDLNGHTARFRDPVSATIDESISGSGNKAITILYSQSGLRFQAESSY